MRTIRAVLAAVLLVAPASAAEEEDERMPPDLPATSACECLKSKRCWRLVQDVIKQNATMAKTEVEAAVQDRFFPGVATFVPLKPDAEGHFLMLQCPGSGGCADKRDELEKRFIVTTLLSSLPLGVPRKELYDPMTWLLTSRGEKIYTQAKSCKPGLLAVLVAAAHAGRY